MDSVDTVRAEADRYLGERFSSSRSFGGFPWPTDPRIGARKPPREFDILLLEVRIVLEHLLHGRRPFRRLRHPPHGEARAAEHGLATQDGGIDRDPPIAPSREREDQLPYLLHEAPQMEGHTMDEFQILRNGRHWSVDEMIADRGQQRTPPFHRWLQVVQGVNNPEVDGCLEADRWRRQETVLDLLSYSTLRDP